MRLRRLRLSDFRHIAEREVEFDDGVTIVEGPNEIGKSALAAALKLLLDPKIKHGSQAEAVKRECPADRDAWPTVEAEFECGAYRFVFRKRFGRGSAGGTELELKAPKVETLKGDDAVRRLDKLLGTEVDLPLFHALQVEQGVGLQALSVDGQGWLADSLDEAVGGAGQRDDHEPLFERARAEFEVWFTRTGRDREGTELTSLRRQVADAVERSGAAAAALDSARTAVDALERAEREVTELAARLPTLIAERDRAERDLAELTDQRDELARLDRGLDGRRQLAEQLERTVADRRQRATSIATTRAGLEAARAELEAREVQLRNAEAAHRAAGTALDTAQKALKQAIALRELRERDLDDARGEQHLDELRQRRQRVEPLLEELAPLEQRAARPVDEVAASAVTETSARLDAAREAAKRGAPSVTIEALGDVAIELDGERRSLARGETIEPDLRDELEIRVPETIAVRVHAGTSSDALLAAVERGERELEQALRTVGATTVAEARQLWAEISKARAQLAPRRQQLADLTKDLPDSERGPLAALDHALLEAEARLQRSRSARPAMPEPPADAIAATRLLESAANAEREARDTAEARQSEVDTARQELDSLREAVGASRVKIDTEQARLQQDAAELEEEREREADEALAVRTASARAQFDAAQHERQTLARALEQADLDGKKRVAENARQVVLGRRRDLESLEAARHKLSGQVETLGGQGLFETLEQCQRTESELEANLARVERRAAAAKRLFEVLTACRDEARTGYRQPLRERIETLAMPVFGDGLSIELDDELRIVGRTLDGTNLRFDQLSVGAREQLDLIHRIAVAQLVAPKGGVPLILDDTLGNADPERLRAMNLLLARAGEQVQVIVLTCHPERFERVGGARSVRLGT